MRQPPPAGVHKPAIVDYEGCDFRDFWRGTAKQVLHDAEISVVKRFVSKMSGWFLDLGCGFGRLHAAYASPERKVVLVDYSLKHLHVAAQTIPTDGAQFVAANALCLPFATGVFAGGVCIRLLHHIDSLDVCLDEIARVLTPGAMMLLTYMNGRSLLRMVRYGRSCMMKSHIEISPTLYATHPAYMQSVLEKAGFRVLKQTGVGTVHQLVHDCVLMNGFLDAVPTSRSILATVERMSDYVLGPAKLALMQYVLVERMTKGAARAAAPAALEDILVCPRCKTRLLHRNEGVLVCPICGSTYCRSGRVLDMRYDGDTALTTRREE